MIDPNIKPLCDQMQGVMVPTTLSNELVQVHGFRCEFCQRTYTLASGYRTDGTAGPPDAGQPRCKEHHYAMYVSERLPNLLRKYRCPEEECVESATVEVELDEADGFLKPKQMAGR